MKNKILSAFLFSILALLVFNSCKKENIDTMDTNPDEVIPDTIVCNLSSEIFSFPEQEPSVLEIVASGGNTPLNYLWSTGSVLSQIEPPQDTTYSVTVTDALGCTTESMFEYIAVVNNCDIFTVEIITIDSVAPNIIKAIPNMGIPPFLYTWSEGSTIQQIEVVLPGTFAVTVEDANGCLAEDEIIL